MADVQALQRTDSHESSLEKKDVEKTPDVHDIDIAHVTGAEFDDPNIDKNALVDLEDDSPYPEVRSAVANTDDPDMPVNTLRAWVIGIVWAIGTFSGSDCLYLGAHRRAVVPGLNQFFFFRYPSVTITGLVAQLLSFPMGRLWAYALPNVKIFGIAVNPGPFTVKEYALLFPVYSASDTRSARRHVLVTIMASVGAGSAYAVSL